MKLSDATATFEAYELGAVRAALPALRDITYLNVGSEGIMAEPVLREHLRALAWHETHGHYAHAELHNLLESSRARLARLLDVGPEDVVLATNATDGVNLVACGHEWEPDDEVLTSDQEHHAVILPFINQQRLDHLRVRIFRISPDPEETVANFRNALTSRTRLAAFSQVSCETGIRLPVCAMCDQAAERGVHTLVDGAQSVGQFPVHPDQIGADYLTGNGHKWLCGPKGTGFLYVARHRLAGLLPPYVGAESAHSEVLASRRYDDLDRVQLEFEPSVRRFEFGTRSLGRYAALGTAIDYLEALGWENIWRHQATMATRLKELLADFPGATVHTPLDPARSCGIVTVSFRRRDGSAVDGVALSRWLWRQGIIQRRVIVPNGIRLSCAYFTSTEDLDRLIAALRLFLGTNGSESTTAA